MSREEWALPPTPSPQLHTNEYTIKIFLSDRTVCNEENDTIVYGY